MNQYMIDQLRKRRRGRGRDLLSIIPISDLKAIYRRVAVGKDRNYSAPEHRQKMLADWDTYQEEIKNWISVTWEGW